MQIEKVIEKLGYKRKEAQVYVAMLLLGESTVADIASKAKIPRTSTLIVMDKLYRDGLINYYTKRQRKYWLAENPEKILSHLQEKQETLRSYLPRLKALRQNAINGQPMMRVYNGAKEIRHILEDIIETKHDFLGIVAWNDLVDHLGQEYINDFISTQINHFLKVRFLIPKTEQAVRFKESDGKQSRETRFLPPHIRCLDTATFIYGKKVAIISLNPTMPTGFVIDDPDVHKSMTIFFEELWTRK